MSYVVEVRRTIKMHELLAELGKDRAFRITRQDGDTLDIEWTDGDAVLELDFRKGLLSTTSPTDAAMRALSQLADRLGAEVVGEEDLIPLTNTEVPRSVFAGRTTWIGWPILVVVLACLLIWRW